VSLPKKPGYYWIHGVISQPVEIVKEIPYGTLFVHYLGQANSVPLTEEHFKQAVFVPAEPPSPTLPCLPGIILVPSRLTLEEVLLRGEILYGLRLAVREEDRFWLYQWDPARKAFMLWDGSSTCEANAQRFLAGEDIEVPT
jgi:hypothetical protein